MKRMKLYKVKKAFDSYKPGAVIQLSEQDAKRLIESGIVAEESRNKKGFAPAVKAIGAALTAAGAVSLAAAAV